ncbi:hypothetical protein B9G55_08280 [Saccharibacillus sp. O16]|nr:hypothetical protein B9G55_08280 [Saccharibacillus sp. O16]
MKMTKIALSGVLAAPLFAGTTLASPVNETETVSQSVYDMPTESSDSETLSPGEEVLETAPEVSAEEEQKYDDYLREHGYPEDLVSLYEFDQKKQLYEDGAYFVVANTVRDSLDEQQKSGQITPQALQDKNFTHTVSLSRIKTSQKGIAQFKVNYNWSWNHVPDFSREDKFGLAWSGDYDVVDNSAKHSYKLTYLGSGTKWVTSGGVQQRGYEDIQPGTGIGWAVNLVSRGIQQKHKGWATMTLQAAHDNSGQKVSNSIVANYYHTTYGFGSPELSFSSDPSISVGASFTQKVEAAIPTSHTFTWTKSDYLK